MTPSWSAKRDAQALYNRLWGSGFLPSRFQGIQFQSRGDAVHYVGNPEGVCQSTQRQVIEEAHPRDQVVRDIRRRIRSVKNTRKITRAMEMVAAARKTVEQAVGTVVSDLSRWQHVAHGVTDALGSPGRADDGDGEGDDDAHDDMAEHPGLTALVVRHHALVDRPRPHRLPEPVPDGVRVGRDFYLSPLVPVIARRDGTIVAVQLAPAPGGNQTLYFILASIGIFTLPEMEFPFATMDEVMRQIRRVASELVNRGKFPMILGGEHSITPPVVAAVAAKYPGLSVLQLDAHADLRESFMGTPHNHACAMRRTAEFAPITQVGIRSLSTEEAAAIPSLKTTIVMGSRSRAAVSSSGMLRVGSSPNKPSIGKAAR